jgi:hypothetical protein
VTFWRTEPRHPAGTTELSYGRCRPAGRLLKVAEGLGLQMGTPGLRFHTRQTHNPLATCLKLVGRTWRDMSATGSPGHAALRGASEPTSAPFMAVRADH